MAEYLQPETIAEAAGMIAEHGGELAIMAGGTRAMQFLVPYMPYIMGLRRLGLERVEKSDGEWSLGAAATLTQIQKEVPIAALRDAARQIGAVAIQNVATIGGNLFSHAPYGDAATVLLALDARVSIADGGGERSLSLGDFYADGVDSGALVTGIQFAEPKGEAVYLKCGRKRFNATTVITVAVHVEMDGGNVRAARIALGGASPHPMRCTAAEQALGGAALDAAVIEKAAAAASAASAPASDATASEWYRRRMVGVYVQKALSQLA
ncbi:MAG: FAD binding domain-containing protein [Alphaproteobacteria bacterium]|jgi:CO/xanthine dehydrogenase FAD-binding subunit|nr:FAD binding domain-containing protein [Alphaproteobacteria bacterium]MDP6591049.1 FAD binding domain-containing protein [Alphaproteobacteria bacterium]